MGLEKAFENRVKRFLESKGIYPLGTPRQKMKVKPIGYWEKRFGGGTFTKSGLPDMHIVVKGQSIDVELKAPKGKPSELQIFTIEQINECGGCAMVLYPKDFGNFKNLIERLIV